MFGYGKGAKEAALAKLKIKKGGHLSKKLVRMSKRTKEHLVRKADGGGDTPNNIVYAHMYCNSCRDDRTVEEHKAYIQKELKNGTHPLVKLKTGETDAKTKD
jgi:hypothetical protein